MTTFQFIRAHSGTRQWPKTWLDALASTGRFYRSAQGKVLFLAQQRPDEFVALARYQELQGIVESGEVIQLTGDTPDENDYKSFWHALSDARWRLPSASCRGQQTITVPQSRASR